VPSLSSLTTGEEGQWALVNGTDPSHGGTGWHLSLKNAIQLTDVEGCRNANGMPVLSAPRIIEQDALSGDVVALQLPPAFQQLCDARRCDDAEPRTARMRRPTAEILFFKPILFDLFHGLLREGFISCSSLREWKKS